MAFRLAILAKPVIDLDMKAIISQWQTEHLIANKIFVATYWPYVIKTCTPDMIEYDLASHLIALPIDQRYGLDEMKYILSVIDQFNKIRKL